MKPRIILCAGHGGGDPGAAAQGTTEAVQVIDIVNRTAAKLKADGQLEVIVVPHDLNLVPAIGWVNQRYKNLNDGYALEVHKNAGGGTGIETFFFANDNVSKNYAARVNNETCEKANMVNRGVKPDSVTRFGRLGWVRDTNTWAGLIEMGFIDKDHLDNERYANALFHGVLNIWGLDPKAAPVVTPPVVVAPTPAPPAATWLFKVVDLAGKQLGVYSLEANAWNKYKSVAGQARILDKAGADVTGAFVMKFEPPKPTIPVPPQPDPVPSPSAIDQENNAILKRIEATINWIKDLLNNIFKGGK